MNICVQCGEKPAVDYPRKPGNTCLECRNQRYREWRNKNREKVRKASKEYRARKPETVRNGQLKYEYGITLDDYNRLLGAQNGVCAICKLPDPTKRLSVDHSHTTNAVRGLLCGSCNRALGLFKECPDILHGAIEYINAYLPRLKQSR